MEEREGKVEVREGGERRRVKINIGKVIKES